MKYDYLIIGAGLYGATFAQIKKDTGYTCLVIDRRDHIAGNVFSKKIENIEVHMYGPHIFHTDNKDVWNYVNRFAEFNHFIYSPIAHYKDELYNLPFNMNTFTRIWPDVKTPEDARKRIREQVEASGITESHNLEEQAVSLVGTDIYEKLIKYYTEKQWGRPCRDLPAFIIRRLPVRYTFDNNYFNHPYQGIPVDGYTAMVEKMLEGIDVRTGVDYLQNKEELVHNAEKVVYTGQIDEYYGYRYGALQYRSLRFETITLDMPDYQGVAGMNYTDKEHPYTRIVEHKHFTFGKGNANKTVITKEYSKKWEPHDEPYYPVNDAENNALYEKYKKLAGEESGILFGGRLGTYRYMDMDQIILQAMTDSRNY